jgi:hypothetical protein
MYITKEFIEKAGGPRSPMVRWAMVQAGNKHRVDALKKFLISAGSCEITFREIEALGLTVFEKKYSFCASPLTYVLLDSGTFGRFKPIKNSVDLEIACMRDGVIGIRRRDTPDA